ncbi:hypothetical protein PHYSODRAFT_296028 [Phytophthora sojae]|uniref:Ammonium transporter AmtB-like domain-containing protein n=1 Tax=Phytophthora sojae (strain P6497) TaxID=1094619 RepID=G4YVX4_PHYSP|nr:hypothetical protein PHYSODRAFT_296028 [Phytophthora sojae]EGZ23728.1 hypothetical protein PHYSODRAFT_296028 [Phytophthora sojae]|eukprot:XP_009519016.1 hypothetical protein PHYSODRAFT_296028 [Phytophthora sojae]
MGNHENQPLLPSKEQPSSRTWPSQQQGFAWSLMAFQTLCLLCFAWKFDLANPGNTNTNTNAETDTDPARLRGYYTMYMDVHVMIFVGFGFLMTFLRKYSMSAVSLNFIVAVMSLQWGIIVVTLVHQFGDGEFSTKIIDVPTLINGDFAAGAVLISFGALLGKITPTQLVWMTFLEIIFYAINEFVLTEYLEVVDAGGSMVIHAFGAFFGLALTIKLGVPSETEQIHNTSQYNSDVFAMIGTLFLWIYWPSFCAAMVPAAGFQQERAVVATVLSISASCASAFAATKVMSHAKKFDMVHVQNATLAGGVAIGTSCNLGVSPVAAITIGLFAGFASVFGYCFVSPFLERSMRMSDTCGILNLHGMPGVVGGIAAALITLVVSDEYYGEGLTDVYTARAYRSAGEQSFFQFVAIVLTVAFASLSGSAVGSFLMSPRFRQQKMKFEDEEWFHVPDELHA